jgi:hypothetical protein
LKQPLGPSGGPRLDHSRLQLLDLGFLPVSPHIKVY